jgi:hypothetical protein
MVKEVNQCVCCGQPITAEQNTFQALKGVREVVINVCHGGFGLSHKAEMEYLTRAGIEFSLKDRESRDDTFRFGPEIVVANDPYWTSRDIPRDDPVLVQLVKDWKENANSAHAELKIVRIPGDVDWTVEEYDGYEWVAECHRTWN